MKIMFNAYNLGKGGAERVLSILSSYLAKKNSVGIIINDNKKTEYQIDDRIKIFELDKKRIRNKLLRNFARIKETENILKEQKPDIIISFLPVPSFRVLYANRKLKIPIIVSDRNDPHKEYKSIINKILMNKFYKKADAFVFQTHEQLEYFNKSIQDKATIIYNPIKDDFLEDSEKTKYDKTIIAVGRLVPQKNHKMLITAFSKVVEKHSDYTLKIFGKGKLEEELKKHIKNMKLEDKVKLCGISNDIKSELNKSEIFVLASNYEGLPNCLIEAMALGLPVISTDCPCGGPKELIENEKNGILIPVNNKEKMSDAIIRLIEDKELQKSISIEATKIKEKLHPNKILSEWEEYIKFVLNKRSKNE